MRWAQASLPDRMLDILFNHCEFEGDEDVFEVNRHLGDGMVGVVEEVTIRSCEPPIVCARKKSTIAIAFAFLGAIPTASRSTFCRRLWLIWIWLPFWTSLLVTGNRTSSIRGLIAFVMGCK
jgi:hypothetical protein